ncbi:FecR family protein [Verrucomicrobia bacterium]|nr:FecR family protein [Verrucomicrobiota bacterium]
MTKVFLSFQIPEGEEPFVELVLRYLDGAVKREDITTLNEQLKISGLKRRIFIEIVRDQQMIREIPAHALNDKVTSLWVGDEQLIPGFEGADDVNPTKKVHSKSDYRKVAALVACLITVSTVIWGALGFRDTSTLARTISAIATIDESQNADWDEEHIGMGEGAQLSSGVLKLRSGLVRLHTPGGVSLSMEGPAELNLVSSSLVHVNSGRVVVHVPESEIGFRVETDLMNIVDLGTAFGVSVNNRGATELSVFQGLVEAFDAKKGGAGRILRQGSSIKIAPDSKKSLANTTFRRGPYTKAWRFNMGIETLHGKVEPSKLDLSADPYAYEDDTYIMLFTEESKITLQEPLQVNIATPGSHTNFSNSELNSLIPAKTRVKSFLIQLNPIGSDEDNVARRGGIAFDRPILGAIVKTTDLIQSDALFAIKSSAANRRLGNISSRGLETATKKESNLNSDLVMITPDRMKISVRLNAGKTLDHIRVIVADPE